jgi:hypothetical protein
MLDLVGDTGPKVWCAANTTTSERCQDSAAIHFRVSGKRAPSAIALNPLSGSELSSHPTIDGILGRLHAFAGHLEQPVAPPGRVCFGVPTQNSTERSSNFLSK